MDITRFAMKIHIFSTLRKVYIVIFSTMFSKFDSYWQFSVKFQVFQYRPINHAAFMGKRSTYQRTTATTKVGNSVPCGDQHPLWPVHGPEGITDDCVQLSKKCLIIWRPGYLAPIDGAPIPGVNVGPVGRDVQGVACQGKRGGYKRRDRSNKRYKAIEVDLQWEQYKYFLDNMREE